MHAAVYQERPDVNAIVHTHQPYASALALVRQPIPALFDEQVRFLGRSVEIIDYAPSGTGFLKQERAQADHQRRQRLHPRQPRRAGARRRRGPRRLQHGPAREGGARLPAGADDRREGRARCRRRSARSPSPSCAATRRSSSAQLDEARDGGVAGAGGRRARAPAQRPPGPRAAPAEPAGAAARRLRDQRVPGCGRRVRAPGRAREPAAARPSGGRRWTSTSTTSRRSAAAARSSPTQRGELIPGGVQHNLAFNYPFPLAIEKAEGAHLWDVDGNELHRLPAGRRPDRPRQQLRASARAGRRGRAPPPARSPASSTSTSSSWPSSSIA